ncbi:carbamoyl-phosphate synthase large subunit [Microbacteriaceae bacterium SG_E_30_P1]|uniref:Carbamoyl-phosphate synthase large subunit n=1 Tax=Antiquaquibacter oligotrophicus TaxID=2880260 RepID=A0ABT6KPM5_9MICO|nr:ATP-grasp domain-containing protein [Antiquaquibacter oligotrophicus]MDH6181938.1 carbamoyl-phosphate synthase large subunit [Antiquaquibacter oligotrophicus]UDF12392.1 ATP-grasp domain-containing protein [Antiquaquibacter oligotrophicus]
MTRVLVTGAGGAAGVAVIRSLMSRGGVEVLAADMDGWAAGLYLVPPHRRRIVQPGAADDFVDGVLSIVRDDAIDVVFSTVDVELPPLAARRAELAPATLAAPSLETIQTCLDKLALARACANTARVPETEPLTAEGVSRDWEFPVIVKPRRGAGSRGVRLIADRAELEAMAHDDSIIIQANLPGEEYSVDVIAVAGAVIAAVPRTRTRVDSGVSIAGQTVLDPELQEQAALVAAAIGLDGVANIQLRREASGRPALLEVNPRFPGALPLTIAAGVDLPSFALDLALGRPLPAPDDIVIRELATVRFLEDIVVDPAEVLHSDHAAHGAEDG